MVSRQEQMERLQKERLRESKELVTRNNLEGLIALIEDWKNTEQESHVEAPDWVYIFQKTQLHACLKGRSEIVNWLTEVAFPQLGPIDQIAIRQMFPQGRHLLRQAAQRAH